MWILGRLCNGSDGNLYSEKVSLRWFRVEGSIGQNLGIVQIAQGMCMEVLSWVSLTVVLVRGGGGENIMQVAECT